MKTRMLFTALFVSLIFMPLKSQTYSPSDSIALLSIEATCDSTNQLNWETEPDPFNWTGVTWNDSIPKRVTKLNVQSKLLKDTLDVSSLTSLSELSCGFNLLTGLNVSSLTNLIKLNCRNNPLYSLDISSLANLRELTCYTNQLDSLDLSAFVGLTILNCGDNHLTSLDLSSLTSLTELDCSSNDLTSLDVLTLDNLTKLNCGYNQLTDIDVTGMTNLTVFDCSKNEIDHLNISTLTNLNIFGCVGNNLTQLDINMLTNLRIINCSSNLLGSLNVANLSSLTTLYCGGNRISSIDVSSLNNLTTFNCTPNKLPFSSLATGLHVNTFYYAPQDTIFIPVTLAGPIVIDYSTEAIIDDSITSFVFYENDTAVDTSITGLYTTTGQEVYNCKMTNGRFPGLILTTAKITISSDTVALSVSPSALFVDYKSNSIDTFTISSNTAWNVSSSDSWLTVSPSWGFLDDTIIVKAKANHDTIERSTIVTVSAIGVSPMTITVTQAGKTPTATSMATDIVASVYPCPVIDVIKVNLSQKDLPSAIGIYTIDGKQLGLMKIKTSAIEIDMKNYPSGIYILKIITSGYTIEKKILKQ